MTQARALLVRSSFISARWLVLLTLAAALLRGLWLAWQPLWWDEGYSIYFATEPIRRMVALTAADIHPPLYYLLLHGWLATGVDPLHSRLFSVVVGALAIPLFAIFAAELYPQRRRVQLLAALLLLLNPLHIYYSQEVRMYGLALLLGIASSLFLVRSLKALDSEKNSLRPFILYWLATTLGLYTLYYLGFLLLAQLLWTVWRLRTRWRMGAKLLATWLAIVVSYLPWLLYAGLKLTAYVKHKVASDKDQPLSIGEFLIRHISAFSTGHSAENSAVFPPQNWIVLLILITILFFSIRRSFSKNSHADSGSTQLLWILLLMPTLCAFIINQFSPFFPANGERLLIFVLPYFLLLLATGIDTAYHHFVGRLSLAALFALSLAGIVSFYTTPRYSDDDYRPLIRQIVQQSTSRDTFLATFPWQIGFWRAYAKDDLIDSAQPQLLSDVSVVWGDEIKTTIEQALQSGMIWFPSLLSIGSTLPQDVNAYFTQRAAFNVADRWFSETTRLDAWRKNDTVSLTERKIDFGELQVNGVGIAPQQVVSANEALDLRLRWTIADPNHPLNLSLRLLDPSGQIWMQRDYRLASHWLADPKGFAENIGLIVPPGLPPADYQLVLGVNEIENDRVLTTQLENGKTSPFADLGTITVGTPQEAISPSKLPIDHPLNRPQTVQGTAILGYTGADNTLLAGDLLEISLFYQKQTNNPKSFNLFVSLLDQNGAGVAGWEGWPLPTYPILSWSVGALTQVPVVFDLPATVKSGSYRLVTGLIDSESGEKSTLTELGNVQMVQRVAHFESLNPNHPLAAQPLLGSHATLLGYDLETNATGTLVRLYWHVEETLLPAHHIFVHFDNAANETVAQVDGSPITVDGRAPTGSWQPGETLVTLHQLNGAAPIYDRIRVGLYNPRNDQRLPVSINGAVIGDAVELH